jgi:hypothetical protein
MRPLAGVVVDGCKGDLERAGRMRGQGAAKAVMGDGVDRGEGEVGVFEKREGVQVEGMHGEQEERQSGRDERGAVVSKCGGRMHDLLGTRCDPYGMFPPSSPCSCPPRLQISNRDEAPIR